MAPTRSRRTSTIKKTNKAEANICSQKTNKVHAVKVKSEFVKIKKDVTLVKKKKKNTNKVSSKGRMHSVGIRPTADESRYATMSLSKLHPDVVNTNDLRRKTMLEACGMRGSITDSIISTMLSQNTTDANSRAAWSKLKKKFPDWEAVVECEDITLIEDTIRVAGLAATRAKRIQDILRTVKKERGVASLDYIRNFNDVEVKKELSRFKGLGPKTISCVLLFALGRDEFPVDTHVLRITQKMGWVSSGASREAAYEYLNDMIPSDVKMDLHCLLVRHGKVCHRCAANGRPQFPPIDGKKLVCPLVDISTWSGLVPEETMKSLYVACGKEKHETMLPVAKKVKVEGDDFENAIPRKRIKSECSPNETKSENQILLGDLVAPDTKISIKDEVIPEIIKSECS